MSEPLTQNFRRYQDQQRHDLLRGRRASIWDENWEREYQNSFLTLSGGRRYGRTQAAQDALDRHMSNGFDQMVKFRGEVVWKFVSRDHPHVRVVIENCSFAVDINGRMLWDRPEHPDTVTFEITTMPFDAVRYERINEVLHSNDFKGVTFVVDLSYAELGLIAHK